jgi:hypothetical protein
MAVYTKLLSKCSGKVHLEGKRQKAKTASFSFVLKNQQITSLTVPKGFYFVSDRLHPKLLLGVE